MTPKVSIIVPIYNVSKHIERCAISLFEQTFDELEYVFVNDCTPDDSMEILQQTIDKYGKRVNQIRIFNHETNRGLSAARNTGLNSAKGEYILHIDSDDFVEKDMVRLLYEKAVEEEADIVISPYILEWEKVAKVTKEPFPAQSKEYVKLLLSGSVSPGVAGKLIRKALYIENNISAFEGINMGEDYVVSPRLAYFASKIAKVDKTLYHYVQTNESAYTKTYTDQSVKNLIFVLDALEHFFYDKPDFEIFRESLERGQLKKKIDLLMFAEKKHWKHVSELYPESNKHIKNINLTCHERLTFHLSKDKMFKLMNLYFYIYQIIFKIVQKMKRRI